MKADLKGIYRGKIRWEGGDRKLQVMISQTSPLDMVCVVPFTRKDQSDFHAWLNLPAGGRTNLIKTREVSSKWKRRVDVIKSKLF